MLPSPDGRFQLVLTQTWDLLDHVKDLETIKPRARASPVNCRHATAFQNTKTREVTPVRGGPSSRSSLRLSPQSAEFSCLPSDQTRRRMRKWNKMKERERERGEENRSSAASLSFLEFKKDSWRNAFMAGLRDCSFPSNTWDSFTLVGHRDGATNTRPPQEGKREKARGKRQN